ncbi:hypothetical protein ACP70R_024769 [Stipagrostis hirtigluma subsp. patula]
MFLYPTTISFKASSIPICTHLYQPGIPSHNLPARDVVVVAAARCMRATVGHGGTVPFVRSCTPARHAHQSRARGQGYKIVGIFLHPLPRKPPPASSCPGLAPPLDRRARHRRHLECLHNLHAYLVSLHSPLQHRCYRGTSNDLAAI